MPESEPLDQITPSPVALRALAHPVRLRLLGLLRFDGPSTATRLAERLGLNSGATSYHLRQLAQHGFVVEDSDRGNSRDRWWRAAHRSTRTDEDAPDAAARDATDAFMQAAAVVRTEQLQRAMEDLPMLPSRWRRASVHSDWLLHLTPAQAEELRERLESIIEEYAGTEPEPDSAQLVLQLYLFPRPGTVTEADA
jgi:predicted ArsR family transcriptional regulator